MLRNKTAVECYNILKYEIGEYIIDKCVPLKKLMKQYTRRNIRKYFFSQRVNDDWNRLPQAAVDAETVDQFKLRN